jgi:inner membrane protein
MMGTTHVATGVAAGIAIVGIAGPPPAVSVLIVAVAAYSALVPDVDHPTAPAARCLGPVSWLICQAVRAISVEVTGDKHRGWSHSVAFCLLWGLFVGGCTLFLGPVGTAVWTGLAAAVGAVTHVVGDMFTLTGCAYVAWPFRLPVKHLLPRFMRFRTNGSFEQFVQRHVISTRIPGRRRARRRR